VTRFTLITFVCVSSLFTGCYASHVREEMEPPVVIEPTCAPESDLEPVVSIEMGTVSDIEVEAGTRRATALAFSVGAHSSDVEIAEFPGTFRALDGASLTTPSGAPALTLRFRVNGLSSYFGPEESEGTVEDTFELWNAWLVRDGDVHDFELTVEVAEDASGTYEITVGNDCDLTPRAWFVTPEGETPDEPMPMELIGNNAPITFRITVVPSGI
jgi:hypothetical protein